MLPRRVELQLAIAKERSNTLIGSKFVRIPEDATPRYSAWFGFDPKSAVICVISPLMCIQVE
jgi:hypothetical protein